MSDRSSDVSDESTSIMVKRFAGSITAESLYTVFSKCGRVLDMRIVRDRERPLQAKYAFIVYEHPDEAHDAKKEYDGESHAILGGRPLTIGTVQNVSSEEREFVKLVRDEDLDLPVAAKKSGYRCREDVEALASRHDRIQEMSIMLKNIPPSMTPIGLYHLCSPFGEIIDSRVIYDRETNRARYGFVVYSNDKASRRAIDALNHYNGYSERNKLSVDIAKGASKEQMDFLCLLSAGQTQEDATEKSGFKIRFDKEAAVRSLRCATLMVKNLPNSLNDESLYKLFRPFGFIADCYISAGKSKDGASQVRYGVVIFASGTAATRALNALNGHSVDGGSISVEVKDKNAPEQKDFTRLTHALHDYRVAAEVSRYRINLRDRPSVEERSVDEDEEAADNNNNSNGSSQEVDNLRKRVKELEALVENTKGANNATQDSNSPKPGVVVDPRHARVLYTPMFVVSVVARLPNFSTVRNVTAQWIADGAVNEEDRRQAWQKALKTGYIIGVEYQNDNCVTLGPAAEKLMSE